MDCGNVYTDPRVRQRLDLAMPLVGLYIAAASAICTLAMAADVFIGLRKRMFWFPCKYFSLNAATLTLLAVAMKPPVDLDPQGFDPTDWATKLVSLIFMITAMCNLMPSSASNDDNATSTNVLGLGILVVTILVNIWIQTDVGYVTLVTPAAFLMLLMLVTIISSATTFPVSKQMLESKYQEMHKEELREQKVSKRSDSITINKQTVDGMKKYWVVAETGNPQFVVARSILCITAGVICLCSAVILLVLYAIWLHVELTMHRGVETVYGRYTKWILAVQSIGVVVGMIAPLCRWFMAVKFKCSGNCEKISWKKEIKVEAHWIQTLVDWRDNFSVLQNQNLMCNKYLYNVKWFFLTFCIALQVLVVLFSKLLLLISVIVAWFFFSLMNLMEKFRAKHSLTNLSSNQHIGLESIGQLNLNRHVLLLEGEAKLPTRTLADICHRAEKLIQKGKTERPQNVIGLLTNTRKFNGVREFDCKEVRSLHSQEPPNCWSLPLVTIMSIAIALPNVLNHKITQLMSCLDEGLSLTRLVDETLDADAQFVNIRRAADMGWGGVALYRKWQGFDLRKASSKYRNSKEVLEELSRIAKTTVLEFSRDAKDLAENPPNWPAKIIAANSMYRICQTILLSYPNNEDEPTDEELFNQLSARITGILAACLTNLARVITTLCYCNAIEKREKSAQKAFLLLGKTEEILELLQQYEWPSTDLVKVACIDDWCALFEPDNDVEEVKTVVSNRDQMSIEIQ